MKVLSINFMKIRSTVFELLNVDIQTDTNMANIMGAFFNFYSLKHLIWSETCTAA
jgi:hypothetical protein